MTDTDRLEGMAETNRALATQDTTNGVERWGIDAKGRVRHYALVIDLEGRAAFYLDGVKVEHD